MATAPNSQHHPAFGPFELSGGKLLKYGKRVRLSGQPLRILLVMLAHSGDLVTREQLREEVWGEGTFVDFEHGLNAAVNKLRRALGDSAKQAKYIETVPGRGYRFIGPISEVAAMSSPPASAAPIYEAMPAKPLPRRLRWLLAVAACLTVSFALAWRSRDPSANDSPLKLIRLTATTGLSTTPAISRDGKLLAYASDQDSTGDLDLYVRQVAGVESLRLTSGAGRNLSPDFSPDGSRIVFRSSRNGGGIYDISTLGGQPRQLTDGGFEPKFSPDGSQIVYWVGPDRTSPLIPGTGTVAVMPAGGGQARPLGREFTTARHPIWSPDGKHVLLIGYTSLKTYDTSAIDWWLAATDGGGAVRTGAFEALLRAGLQRREPAPVSTSISPDVNVPIPTCWSAMDNSVIFSVTNGDSQNLWAIRVSPQTGKVLGGLRRLTTGAANEVAPSCAPTGEMVFASINMKRDLWSLPFDLDRGSPIGPLEHTAQSTFRQETPYFSGDGRFLAFASDQAGPPNIWMRELTSGKELQVAASPFAQRYPVVTASGDRIAYSVFEKERRVVYLAARGGTAERLCAECLRATDWSRDEKRLLVSAGSPMRVDMLDVVSHQQTPLLESAHSVIYARFSPDNRWVSFTSRVPPGGGIIMIAPADGQTPVPETSWISIAEAGADDYADWSPSGEILYYTSGKDGHTCLWGRRIDRKSGQPVGSAFAAEHLHGPHRFIYGGWSIGGGRIGLALAESTGSIWMVSRLNRQ